MQKVIKYVFDKKFDFLLILSWVFIVVFTAFHHEIWYDEIHFYNLIKTSDFSALMNIIQTKEGHPLFWFFSLYPFVRLGFPPQILQVLSFAFMFLAVCYFCLRNKCGVLTKILFLFSSGMLYFFPVIARNYSLIPLFLFILADLYPKRHQSPILYVSILIIISQIHILLWGFSGICAFLFVFEFVKDRVQFDKAVFKTHLLSLFLLLSDFVLTLYFFRGLIFTHRTGGTEFVFNLHLLKEFLFFLPSQLFLEGGLFVLFLIALFMFCVSLFELNKKSFVIFVSSLFAFEFILIIIYQMFGVPLQKIFTVYLLLMFSYLLVHEKKEIFRHINEVSLVVLLLVFHIAHPSYRIIKDEIQNNFSNLSVLSGFFKDKLGEDEKILQIGSSMFFEAYLDYLPKNSLLRAERELLKSAPDNASVENYVITSGADIRYIIISDDIKNNFDEPYKKIYKSPENKVRSVFIFQPPENNFSVWERL